MLVLLNRLDIEERLPELKDIVMTQGVERVYLASVSSSFSSSSRVWRLLRSLIRWNKW